MDYINKILSNTNASIEELISCFEQVKKNGGVAAIKFDGERDSQEYNVFISFPKSKREIIRADESNLKAALIKVLTKYVM